MFAFYSSEAEEKSPFPSSYSSILILTPRPWFSIVFQHARSQRGGWLFSEVVAGFLGRAMSVARQQDAGI